MFSDVQQFVELATFANCGKRERRRRSRDDDDDDDDEKKRRRRGDHHDDKEKKKRYRTRLLRHPRRKVKRDDERVGRKNMRDGRN